ncbi:hypothetical protein [Paenibacillus turpanensis]|uniref:hypothetical protein n=1 Tax=Paenibacillus turpanensis TaxID=2689078 RepID=UPI001409CB3A|nr:hypothetical protein [Paenibacillus turpanensis]
MPRWARRRPLAGGRCCRLGKAQAFARRQMLPAGQGVGLWQAADAAGWARRRPLAGDESRVGQGAGLWQAADAAGWARRRPLADDESRVGLGIGLC